MQEEIIEEYRKTPVFESNLIKLLVYVLGCVLSYGPALIAGAFWLLSDWFYALAMLLLSYLLFGIISSKLRYLCIPSLQQEFSYSSYALAAWVIAYYFNPKQVTDES